MADRLRVGIVGVGWGALVHGPALRVVPEFDLAALCGRTPERLAKAAARLGIDDTSTDWESFVRRDDLDVIAVVLPVALHRAVTVAALEAGKHVLCEKPIALSADDARRMTEAAEAAGRVTAVAYELRYLPERAAVADLVAGGTVGNPTFVRITQSAGYWHPTHRPQAPWMYRLEEGGGYLYGLVSHDIDFVCSLFGPPVAVCAEVATALRQVELPDGGRLDVDADDTSVLMLRFEGGALGVLSTSVTGVHTTGYRFEVFGDNGTVRATGLGLPDAVEAGTFADTGLSPVSVSDRRPRSGAEPARGLSGAAIRAMALLLEDWLPAFDGRPSPAPTFRDAWRVAEIVDAARRSSEARAWVDLPRAMDP